MKNKKIFRRLVALAISVLLIVTSVAPPVSAVMPALDKTFTLYMVPNTHLDTAWQSPYQQVAQGNGNNGLQPMVDNAINRLNSNSSFIFTTSASKHYEWVKEYYGDDNPDNRRYWSEVKKLVEAGQWDITGGQLVEPDLNVPSGESFARQSLYAQHFFEREFGREHQPTTGMVPDVFGFAGQLPQVLRKSEMPYFVTSKVNWSSHTGVSAYYEDPETGTNKWRNHRGNDDIGTTRRGRQSDIWHWQGLDGKTSVLSNLLTYDYNWQEGRGPLEGVFEQNWQDGYETGVKIGLFFYGGGDFGQGLRGTGTGDGTYGYVNTIANNPNTRYSVANKGTSGFFKDLDAIEKADKAAVAAGAEPTINIPTHTGEIYLEYHRGTYTTWSRIKEYNRKNENLADSAEKAATLGFYTGVMPSNNSEQIEWAWNRVLTDQMHDVLPGSSVAHQYYQSFNFQEQSANLFNNVRNNALGALAHRADTNVVGKPVFVFNELSWARSGEVTVNLKYDTALPLSPAIVIYEGAAPIFPTKIDVSEDRTAAMVTFMAKGVPAVGYKVFDARLIEGTIPEAPASTLKVDAVNLLFENEYLKMQLNPKTGYISSLQYNTGGGNWSEMFAQGVGMEGAELHVYRDTEERPDQGFDQWDLQEREMNKEPDWIVSGAPLSIDIVEHTQDKVTVRVVKMWNGHEMAQDFTMYPGVDRVDIRLNAEFYHMKRMLKVSFPINADSGFATYETSFGAVERPTDRITPFQIARFEVPGHKWIDVTDKSGDYGVSILNDARYGFDSWRRTVNGKSFVRSRITAGRTPRAQSFASNNAFNPSSPYIIDTGVINIGYSIAPHAGGWESGETVNKGYEFNYPMKAFEAAKGPSGGLGASESLASVNKPNVVMSALKNQNDNQGDRNTVVVRVYEATGKDTSGVTITLPGNVISAKEVNILEHDYDAAHGYEGYVTKNIAVSGKTVTFDIGKYEIITIEAKLEPFTTAILAPSAQKALNLSAYFNRRATSPRSNRRAAFVEGEGTTASPGFSMPEKNWPETGIEFHGINFSVGPKDSNNIVSGSGDEGLSVAVIDPQPGFSKAYIVGFSTARNTNTIAGNANTGATSAKGNITVNYAAGAPTAKEITFNSWRTDLSGWDRYAWTDLKPYVYDTIVHVNTFIQQSTSATNASDLLTLENYLFLYTVDLDRGRAVTTIDLPADSNIKIVAITLADPVPGYAIAYDGGTPDAFAGGKLDAPANVKVAYNPGSDNLESLITWDKVEGAFKYRVYGGRAADFAVGTATLLGTTGSLGYAHLMPLGVTPAEAAAGNDKYYYRVVAVSKIYNGSEIDSDPSAVSAPITISNIDYALGITNGAANNAIVNFGSQQSTTLAAWKATNGIWTTTNDKWSCNTLSQNNGWMSVRVGHDGTLKTIDRIILGHGNMVVASTVAQGSNNSFSLWYSNDSTDGNPNNGTWTQLFDVSGNVSSVTVHELDSPLTVDWVQIRIPPEGGYGAASGASGRDYNIGWLYQFTAAADNPNVGVARGISRSISFTPVEGASANLVNIDVSYTFVGQVAGITEGATEYQWYKKFADRYGSLYAPIPGATGKRLTQLFNEIGDTEGYKCEVVLVDSNGNKGQAFTVETDSPLSTALNGRITPRLATDGSGGLSLELSYDFYSAFNDGAGALPGAEYKVDDSRYQWYKKTAIEVDGKYVEIPGATGKTISQSKAELEAAEGYLCEISVYDQDGSKGKVVDVVLDAWANQLLNASVVSSIGANAGRAVDGLLSTKWEVASSGSGSTALPHEGVFDMGRVKKVDRFKVLFSPADPIVAPGQTRYNDKNPDASAYDFDVSYSLDNENWTTKSIRSNTLPIVDIRLGETVEARYVKITVITPNSSFLRPTNFWDTTNRTRILEFEALASLMEVLPSAAVLYDDGVELVSIRYALGKTVDIKVDVDGLPAGNINVIAAVYNGRGAMLGAKEVPATIGADGVVDCVVADFNVPADAAWIQVFLWADGSYAPVSEAIYVN